MSTGSASQHNRSSGKRGRILVTPRSLTQSDLLESPELAPLLEHGYSLVSGPPGRLPSEDELIDLVPGCDGWLAGVERISAVTLAAATSLRVISRNGAGADAIDHEAALRHGVNVVTAPGANAQGVAELAVMLMLAALRDLPRSNRAMHDGMWQRWMGRELAECTLGVIGMGAIGRLVTKLVSPFGARVVAYDPYASATTIGADIRLLPLADVFAQADIVTLHCPPTPDGSPLVTAELLDLLRDGSVLVNTARSSLVHDGAVYDRLESGRLSSYAVDAFDVEPPVPSPLLSHERTIMTPHLGGYTTASSRRAVEHAVTRLLDILDSTAESEVSDGATHDQDY